MRRRKKYAKVMALAGMLLLAVTGCGRKNKGTEAVTDTSAESAETQVVLEKVTYTATDGSVSIILPDSNWKNTEDRDGKLVFTSAQGEITVDYADSKKKVGTLAFGATEKKLTKRLEKLGVNTEKLEIRDYSFEDAEGIRRCSYTLQYTDTAEGNYYTVTSVMAMDKRGYQVSGTVRKEDPALLASVLESVKSFLVLKDPLEAETVSEESEETEAGTEETGDTSVSGEERYFFDEPGNMIYVRQNSDGSWVDEKGMSYQFYENRVEDENGTRYYYDAPAYRSDASDSGDSASDGNDYYDFYDKDGNYIRATQDQNGNWVGEDGKTYLFGENGVTDSDGNFYPY